MAVSSTANLFSFFSPSKPPTPKAAPTLQFPLTSSISSSTPTNKNASLSSSNNSDDVMSIVCPAVVNANTLYFRSGYNVQVIVDDNEHEEKLIGRFRREVMRAGVIQECKRRRYFENKQDEAKRRTRDAARRNRKRRGPPRNFSQDNQETSKNKKNDEEEDNWELPEGNIPF